MEDRDTRRERLQETAKRKRLLKAESGRNSQLTQSICTKSIPCPNIRLSYRIPYQFSKKLYPTGSLSRYPSHSATTPHLPVLRYLSPRPPKTDARSRHDTQPHRRWASRSSTYHSAQCLCDLARRETVPSDARGSAWAAHGKHWLLQSWRLNYSRRVGEHDRSV